jgi:hypothetical protein
MNAGQAPAFIMTSRKWLRDNGIRGDATIRLEADGLEIEGASGGLLRISTAQMRLARTGWRSNKHGPFFLTRVWLHGQEKPLEIEARGLPYDAYRAVIAGLAAQMARVDGVKRLERGSSHAAALELLVPYAALFLAAVGITIYALDGERTLGRYVPLLVASAALALGIGTASLRWPRPVRSLEEFNRRIGPDPTKVRR